MQLGGRMTAQDTYNTLWYINLIGLVYVWSTMGSFFYVTTFIYIPALYKNEPEVADNRGLLSFFILGQVLLNYFLTIYKNSYYSPSVFKAIPNSTWGHCLTCDAPKPPRTFHCPSCRRCVLKRDHHCFLTTTCVGFYNLRFMIVFCMYSAMAALYTLYTGYQFCLLLYSPIFSWDSWYHYLFPVTVIKWLLGEKPLFFVVHVLMLYWSSVTLVCAMGLGSMQMIFSMFGMTQRDVQQGKGPDMSNFPPILKGLRQIFGPWPLLNFLFPLLCYDPEGDGIYVDSDTAAKLI